MQRGKKALAQEISEKQLTKALKQLPESHPSGAVMGVSLTTGKPLIIPERNLNQMTLVLGISMLAFTFAGYCNVIVIMLPVMLFSIGSELIFANAYAGAFTPFPQIAGTASALFGCIQIIDGFLASAIVAASPRVNQLPLAIIFIVLAALCYLALTLLACRRIGDHSMK